jgi:hypothetical protein
MLKAVDDSTELYSEEQTPEHVIADAWVRLCMAAGLSHAEAATGWAGLLQHLPRYSIYACAKDDRRRAVGSLALRGWLAAVGRWMPVMTADLSVEIYLATEATDVYLELDASKRARC